MTKKPAFHVHALALLIAGGLFGICSFEYFSINYLRAKHRREAPVDAATWTFDGKTNLQVPWFEADLETYPPKINQFRLYGLPADPYVNDQITLRDWLPQCLPFFIEGLLTLPFKDISSGIMWVSYLFPALWFLTIFYFLKGFFQGLGIRASALASASLITVCFGDLFRRLVLNGKSNIGEILDAILGFVSPARPFRLRLPSHYLTLLLTVIVLLAIAAYLGRKDKQSRSREVILGFSLAMLLFVHTFEWIFACATVLCLYTLTFHPRWSAYRQRVSVVLMATASVSIPILLLMRSMSDPTALIRAGLMQARVFEVGGLALCALGVLGLVHAARLDHERLRAFWVLMSASVIAGGLIINSSVVLGWSLQNRHYYMYANTFLCLMATTYLAESTLRSERAYRTSLMLIPVSLLAAFFGVKSVAEKYYRVAALPTSWERAFEWINGNLKAGERVLTISTTISRLIPVHTSAKQLYADGFPLTCSHSLSDNIAGFAHTLKLTGIDADHLLADRWNDMTPTTDHPRWNNRAAMKDLPYARMWAYVLLHHHSCEPGAIEKARAALLDDLHSAAPPEGRYLWWLNTEEIPYLRLSVFDPHSPWKVVFQDRDVYLLRQKGSSS